MGMSPNELQQISVDPEFAKQFGGPGSQIVLNNQLFEIVSNNGDGSIQLHLLQAVPPPTDPSSVAGAATTAQPLAGGTTTTPSSAGAPAAPGTSVPLTPMANGNFSVDPRSLLFPSASPAAAPAASTAASTGGSSNALSSLEQIGSAGLQAKQFSTLNAAQHKTIPQDLGGLGNGSGGSGATNFGGATGTQPLDPSQIGSLQAAKQADAFYNSALQNANTKLSSLQDQLAQAQTTNLPTGKPFSFYNGDPASYGKDVVDQMGQAYQNAVDNLNNAQSALDVAKARLDALTSSGSASALDIKAAQLQQNQAEQALSAAQARVDGLPSLAQQDQLKANAAIQYGRIDSRIGSLKQQISATQADIAALTPSAQQASAIHAFEQGFTKNAFGAVDLSSNNPEVTVAYNAIVKAGGTPTNAALSSQILKMRTAALDVSPEDLATARQELQQEAAANAVPGQQIVDPTEIQVRARALSDKQNTYETTVGEMAQKQDLAALKATEIKAGIAAAVSGYSAYELQNIVGGMFKNGASTKNILEASAAFTAMGIAMHSLNGLITGLIGKDGVVGSLFKPNLQGTFLAALNRNPFGHDILRGIQWLTTFKGIMVLTGVLVFLGWLFSRSKPSSEEQAAETLNDETTPMVWNTGPVMMITAGVALSSMGINLSPNAPMMQSVTVPVVQLNQALRNAVGGQALPPSSERYGTVFVQQGANGSPTDVVYLTPGANGQDTVHAVALNPNVQFTNPGKNAPYIPFFKTAGGQTTPNPQVVQALDAQQQLLHSTQVDNTSAGQSAAAVAAAANKANTTPVAPAK